MRTQTLTVEGVTYYCEHRKCGRAGCKCSNGGDLHGPYWYARTREGDVSYVGKALPDGIETVDQKLRDAERDIDAARRQLLGQAEVLRLLMVRDALSDRQRAMIRDMGFGWCLVLSGSNVETQGDA